MVYIDNAKDILQAFFMAPNKSKYIREIAKDCKLSYERVHHYLKELEKINAIKGKMRGKIKEYQLNFSNELVLKVFSILEMERRQNFYSNNQKMQVWIQKILTELLSTDLIEKEVGPTKTDIKFILLFGSVARKESRETSDIDLLVVVKNKDSSFDKYVSLVKEKMYALTGKRFEIHIVELKELELKWKKEPIYSTIWQDRIVLYADEEFWREILKIGEPT